MKSYVVKFSDWVPEMMKEALCDEKGVYFVFATVQAEGVGTGPYGTPMELLYIGRSKGVKDRVNGQHHRHADILKACNKYAEAFPSYYYGHVLSADGKECTKEDIVRVESALIFRKQPTLNDTADKRFHHEDTIVFLSRSDDTVNKNEDGSYTVDVKILEPLTTDAIFSFSFISLFRK